MIEFNITLTYLFGYLFTTVIAHVMIRLLLSKLWRLLRAEYGRHGHPTSTLQGIIERLLYTTAWLVGQPGFIGIWLALKVASRWNDWSKREHYFDVFLIGSGLSILYAVVGALAIEWFLHSNFLWVILVPSILVLLNLGAIIYVWYVARQVK